MKPSELITVMAETIKRKYPLLLVGPPGIGKTDITHQVAESIGHEIVVMYPAISEPPDFKGYPVYNPETDSAKFVPFDILENLVNTDKPTVVLLDDFGQANQSVQASCMHLLKARRVGDHQISDQVTFIVATNDKTHHAGVSGIIEPVKSRALSIIHMTVDLEDWILWALKNDITSEVIAFMRLRGHDLLSAFQPTTGMTNTPSPRAQESVSNIIKMHLPPAIEFELIKGAAGEGYAVEIRGYLAMYRGLPDIQDVLADPHRAVVPTDPNVVYAYCGALTSVARPENMDKIVTFAKRLPIEYQVKLLQYDCRSICAANHETQAYTDWALENQRMMRAA